MPPRTEKPIVKEVEAVVLDFLQWGYAGDKRPLNQRESIILAIGTKQFKLLELTAKKDRAVNLHDVVYIGDEKRLVVDHVKRRIAFNDLTPTAKGELEPAIAEIIEANEERFIKFYNTAVPVGLKMHMFNLLPGVGAKTLRELLDAREKSLFTSFDDIRARVKSVQKPEKLILERIMIELENPEEKYHLFTQK